MADTIDDGEFQDALNTIERLEERIKELEESRDKFHKNGDYWFEKYNELNVQYSGLLLSFEKALDKIDELDKKLNPQDYEKKT
jgi:chromosome segregation ATPase